MLVSFPEVKTFSRTRSSVLVFIDPGVEDGWLLAEGVVEGAIAHILDSQRDGIEQITELLHQHPNRFSEIHIVSHGAPGCIHLGSGELSLSTLAQHQPQLETWFSSAVGSTVESTVELTAEATVEAAAPSLVLYGCNVAAGDAGEEFLTRLQQILGVAIAASSTPTGPRHLGGNWEFDRILGAASVTPTFQPQALTSFSHTLPVFLDGFEQTTYFEAPELREARKLTFDTASRVLYVATSEDSLLKLTANQELTTVLNDFERLFPYRSTDIHFYEGYVYSSMGDGSLRRIDPRSGVDVEIARLPNFHYESGIDAWNGKLYVSDGAGRANELRVIDLATNESTTLVARLPWEVSTVEVSLDGEVYFSDDNGNFFVVTSESEETSFELIARVGGSSGEFAIDPMGEYLYVATRQNKIERVAIADGSTTTFAEDLEGIDLRDLAFAPSSDGSGASLYALTLGGRIEEISGFDVPGVEGEPTNIQGLALSTYYSGDLGGARQFTLDPETRNFYLFADGSEAGAPPSLLKLSADQEISTGVENFDRFNPA